MAGAIFVSYIVIGLLLTANVVILVELPGPNGSVLRLAMSVVMRILAAAAAALGCSLLTRIVLLGQRLLLLLLMIALLLLIVVARGLWSLRRLILLLVYRPVHYPVRSLGLLNSGATANALAVLVGRNILLSLMTLMACAICVRLLLVDLVAAVIIG